MTFEKTIPNIGYEEPEIADMNIATKTKIFGSLYFNNFLNPDVYSYSSIIFFNSSSAYLSI